MLKVQLLDERAKLPTVAHAGEDLGYDIYALEYTELIPGRVTKVRTGIAAIYEAVGEFHDRYGLLVRDRSSMASDGVVVSGGVIDFGYTGEIIVFLTDTLSRGYTYGVTAGAKIAQLIPMKVYTGTGVEQVASLGTSDRGDKGFGSSGI